MDTWNTIVTQSTRCEQADQYSQPVVLKTSPVCNLQQSCPVSKEHKVKHGINVNINSIQEWIYLK